MGVIAYQLQEHLSRDDDFLSDVLLVRDSSRLLFHQTHFAHASHTLLSLNLGL